MADEPFPRPPAVAIFRPDMAAPSSERLGAGTFSPLATSIGRAGARLFQRAETKSAFLIQRAAQDEQDPHNNFFLGVVAVGVAAAIAFYATARHTANLAEAESMGVAPALPAAEPRLLPMVNIAPERRWAASAKPTAANGMIVNAFAEDLDHPRWLHVLSNGDVLVAETNAPPRPDAGGGLPGGPLNHHWTKGLAASPDGKRLYASIGSNGNIAENGIVKEEGRVQWMRRAGEPRAEQAPDILY